MYRRMTVSKRVRLLAAASVAALLLAGCAGGFRSDQTETRIYTENTKANCALTGTGYANAIVTPARVALPKAAAPITLSCRAPGYRTFVTQLRPLLNAKFLANFAVGSSMGVIVDMVNGHHEKYPERVNIHMEPTAFPTAWARDNWYRRYRVHITRKWDRVVGEANDACNEDSGEEGNCRSTILALKADQNRELQSLEARRRNAPIRPQTTAQRPTPRR